MDKYLSELLSGTEYGFVKTNPHLGKHVLLLGLSGSYSYGTNNENSDLDVRGITLNQKSDLLGMTHFEQYVDDRTDTTIYSLYKAVGLLLNCNPNTIELLGLNPEHYLYLNEIGRELLAHRQVFLSKRAIQSFGGYADQQLRRLQNALARDSYPQMEKEQHILNSIRNAMHAFRTKYAVMPEGGLHVYIDKAVNPDLQTELFVDASLNHYPLRDYKNMFGEMNSIVRDYDKIGKRNKKKDDNHLNKHAMHLIRLFTMAIDILEKGEIVTYRKAEQNLLLEIRNGCFQKADGNFRDEFYQLLSEYEKRLHYAADHSALPDEPAMEWIEEYTMRAHEKVVRDEIS